MPRHATSVATSPRDEQAALTIAELEDCSPFYSFSGLESLDFSGNSVFETRPDPGSQLEPRSQDRRRATFDIDPDNGRVRVFTGRSRRDYTLVVPTDGDQCVLAAGPASAANLARSWFGEIQDDPDAGGSPVTQASLERAHAFARSSTLGPSDQGS
jgi:hypothetical protein